MKIPGLRGLSAGLVQDDDKQGRYNKTKIKASHLLNNHQSPIPQLNGTNWVKIMIFTDFVSSQTRILLDGSKPG
jgi:hypothetical protein